jgi:CRISPR-associated protein Cas5d
MTPSAARGVLDAILFRPQMRWRVLRITALEPRFPTGFPDEARRRPFRTVSIRRNEIQGKIAPRTVETWIKKPSAFVPYLVDSAGREGAQGQNRTQRNSLVLHHVAYLVEATPVLTEKANRPCLRPPVGEEDAGPDTVTKYAQMFERRVRKGQCYHRPYLGVREFACAFAPPDGTEHRLEDWTEDLGLMLYDLQYRSDGPARPGFFQARITQGVLHCDTQSRGPNGEPPVIIHGWGEGGRT